MFDKRVYLEQHLDQLRELLLFEPRGAVWHNANIVLPSNNPEASLGYVILESTEYPAMLLGAVLGIYALWIIWRSETSRRSKTVLSGALSLGVAMGGATLLLYNFIAFGNVFYIPYQAYATPGAAFHSSYAHGWMGLHWTGLTEFLHALVDVCAID